jgi:hypothetical protein
MVDLAIREHYKDDDGLALWLGVDVAEVKALPLSARTCARSDGRPLAGVGRGLGGTPREMAMKTSASPSVRTGSSGTRKSASDIRE